MGRGGVVVGSVGAEILFFGERNQAGCLAVWLGTEGSLLGDFETLVPWGHIVMRNEGSR